ncbi:hypothetical protein MXB_786 [Myxobolus squamalis]|nr:hypothetical protein MXB_786 [Myxobolus squamalis]
MISFWQFKNFFCNIILYLFRCHDRVLYIDIDVHHGDGVHLEQKGSIYEIGKESGSNFSLNIPLKSGVDDECLRYNSYLYVFKPIVSDTIQSFQPSCIVLQCGADSLAGDRLGRFNLSFKCHGFRAYETSILLDVVVDSTIPESSKYYSYYEPDYCLHPKIETSIMNQNSKYLLNALICNAKNQLKDIQGFPWTHKTSDNSTPEQIKLVSYKELNKN